MLYTGLDFHKSFSYITTMDDKGQIVAQKKVTEREDAAGKEEAQYKRFGCLKRGIAVYCQEGNTNNRITQE